MPESVPWVPIGVIVATVTLIVTVLALIVAVLAWRLQRSRERNASIELNVSIHQLNVINLHWVNKSSIIHSVNGIPTLQHLTQGIEMDADRRGLAQAMYGMGLERFNHYVNNRDGVIAEARKEMDELRRQLSDADRSLAEEVGLGLAAKVDDELQEILSQYDALSLQAQEYAMSKCDEHQALQSIARDREMGVPRTDYACVKARIAADNVPLESIIGELPIMWQDLMTINERADPVKPSGKPPKREYFHVLFLTQDEGELEDKKAERDGKWLRSHKHGLIVPYQEPAKKYKTVAWGKMAVPTGKRKIIIDSDPSSEWTTELWRQGGYMDQQYLLHKNGQAPEQLRASYRRRQTRKIVWSIATVLFVVDLVIFITRYIL